MAKFRIRSIVSISLLAVIAAGAGLRMRSLTVRSLWFDESFSWRMAQFSFDGVLSHSARDNHPPLYFLLLKLWISVFGDSVLAMRGLSVLIAAAAMLGMYLFVSEAFKKSVSGNEPADEVQPSQVLGIFSAALVAVSVYQIRWGWEVRMYILGTALVLFSSWALFRALHELDRPIRSWVVYAFFTLALAYTHYYCLFSIASQFIFVCGYQLVRCRFRIMDALRDRQLCYFIMAATIILVGFLPQISVLLRQRSQIQDHFWSTAVNGWDVPFALYSMFVEPEDAFMSFFGSAVVAVLVSAVLLSLLWRPTAGDSFLLVSSVGPLIICLLITFFDTKIFHPRYLLFAHLFLLAAIARLVSRLPASFRHAVAILLVFDGLFVYQLFWEKMDFAGGPGAQAASAYIAEARRPEEPVVVCSGLYYLSNLYHATNRSAHYCYHDGSGVVHYEGRAVLAQEELINKEQIAATQAERLWVVDMDGDDRWGWGRRTVPVPANWNLVQEKRFREAYGVQGTMVVRLYDTRQGADTSQPSMSRE